MAEEEVDAHILKKYEIVSKLGKGVSSKLCTTQVPARAVGCEHGVLPCTQAYGVVWKAVDRKTREVVALKKIFDAFQNATDAQVGGSGLTNRRISCHHHHLGTACMRCMCTSCMKAPGLCKSRRLLAAAALDLAIAMPHQCSGPSVRSCSCRT